MEPQPGSTRLPQLVSPAGQPARPREEIIDEMEVERQEEYKTLGITKFPELMTSMRSLMPRLQGASQTCECLTQAIPCLLVKPGVDIE